MQIFFRKSNHKHENHFDLVAFAFKDMLDMKDEGLDFLLHDSSGATYEAANISSDAQVRKLCQHLLKL